MWRTASGLCTGLLAVFCILYVVMVFIDKAKYKEYLKKLEALYDNRLLLVGCLLYILARLVILVELFRTLCFLPTDAYISTWASDTPHVA
jgi:hypothetical protein